VLLAMTQFLAELGVLGLELRKFIASRLPVLARGFATSGSNASSTSRVTRGSPGSPARPARPDVSTAGRRTARWVRQKVRQKIGERRSSLRLPVVLSSRSQHRRWLGSVAG
jgi:hypothetical protein